jgi:hypothetical protein
VNGQIVKVTRNLEAALRVLREKVTIQAGCKLWIDAICINQADLVEKGREIGRMRTIYRKAADVVVWLGEGDEESDLVYDFINAVAGFLEVGQEASLKFNLAQQLKSHGIEVWNSLNLLMHRSYWSRLWIVQEIAMGNVNRLCCAVSGRQPSMTLTSSSTTSTTLLMILSVPTLSKFSETSNSAIGTWII